MVMLGGELRLKDVGVFLSVAKGSSGFMGYGSLIESGFGVRELLPIKRTLLVMVGVLLNETADVAFDILAKLTKAAIKNPAI
jgi:hypothetical protein